MLYTIGYGNSHIVDFCKYLQKHKIEILFDVRSSPYSRNPNFNQAKLKQILADEMIRYIRVGDRLWWQNFEEIYWTTKWKNGLKTLKESQEIQNTVIMCSEWDYHKCHREDIADDIVELGVKVRHITKDWKLETHIQNQKELF